MSLHVKCPAGEEVNPVLSRNKLDIQCRIEGGLQPAAGSKCCDNYASCKIWQNTRRLDKQLQRKTFYGEVVSEPRAHVLR